MLAISKIRSRYPDVREEQHHEGPQGPVTLALLGAAMEAADEADDDRANSLTSTSDQIRRWASILLRRLLDSDPNLDADPALLECTDTSRRAHVLSMATRDLNSLSEDGQRAVNDALQRELERVLRMLLEDLRQRDDSDISGGLGWLYDLVAESESLGELRTLIAKGLTANDFTIEDVAARFVGLAYVMGGSGSPSSASFSGDLFTKVTGIAARSADHRETCAWDDTSWSRRRQFAVQFIDPQDTDNEVDAHPDETKGAQ